MESFANPMTSEQLAALAAAVPSVVALLWIIIRQQTMIDKLVDSLLQTQETLLKLHPPQTVEGAKILSGEGS